MERRAGARQNVRRIGRKDPRRQSGIPGSLFRHFGGQEHASVLRAAGLRLIATTRILQKEEEQISQINARIRQLEEDETYQRQLEQLSALQQTARNALEDAKAQMKAAKKKREERRRKAASHPGFPLSPEEEKDLIRESQFQKAEYKRMERAWKEQIIPLQQSVSGHEAGIQALKAERKARSAALQQNCSNSLRC